MDMRWWRRSQSIRPEMITNIISYRYPTVEIDRRRSLGQWIRFGSLSVGETIIPNWSLLDFSAVVVPINSIESLISQDDGQRRRRRRMNPKTFHVSQRLSSYMSLNKIEKKCCPVQLLVFTVPSTGQAPPEPMMRYHEIKKNFDRFLQGLLRHATIYHFVLKSAAAVTFMAFSATNWSFVIRPKMQ